MHKKRNKKHFKTEIVKRKGIKYNSEFRKNGSSKSTYYDQDKKEKTSTRKSQESTVLKIAGFATVNELSNMIGVSSRNVIRYCMSLGVMATINQRLDPDLLSLVAYEFGYIVDIIGEDIYDSPKEDQDSLCSRVPIVTIMGHVDHGKTSLLDYIRKTNIIERESGGITQHIGAYNVELKEGRSITFIDTPGHEAFTSMRSRGTKITDIVIIVIDTDDDVMPQTKEAISHAKAASIPIIFALNKIDKPTSQPDKIRKQLANMNLLVEEWGGKYQSQEISAKTGVGIEQLLEKVWLEAELLELMANPNKPASGTVIESSIDKHKGFITTILVQEGTIKIGDYVSSGYFFGKVKAIYDDFNNLISKAGPAKPVSLLGLNGAPSAGDKFKVFIDEKGAKKIALKRKQLQREQSIRTKKPLTLDEIGRRIALTNFKVFNIIIKGDVDGSVEALTDAIQNISTEEISINIIHKGIGQISESDVILANASNAIIIGFNVSTALNARTFSEHKNIDIRLYSVIYDAINDMKNHVMISPLENEQVIGKAEIRNIYNIKKLYTIAGCMVTNGKIYRHLKIRLIREGIVIYNGELASLKRFKEDVKEVAKGYECGLNIKDYNDLKIGDIIEGYEY
ncbi:translation initiation factor IF-2 [Candidatus Uzinura diaspidicola str. ASNER]|uniref:Translation initiation factor IF-2 n=1 Tax=Candidatus Uzinura diaspidicola str. ASNER TaxID=1133592 RepID=L7VJB7_9FLAO|nr:translation initiation factor IF-2 [Candidatus Uzinura diaspidicola str. ASNER]